MTYSTSNSNRRYELDWLRVIAIILLVFFHVGRLFDLDPWHIKNEQLTTGSRYWMSFLTSWRMPLLFFISGAGSYFTFRKSSIQHYLGERFKRLVVPFLFGCLIILPPQTFYEHRSEFGSYLDVYKSYFHYIPYHNGDRSLYHLWFLAYLVLYCLIAIPLLGWLRSKESEYFRSKLLAWMYHPIGLILTPAIAIVIPRLLLFSSHQELTIFVFYLSFFLFGIIYYHDPVYRDKIGANRNFLLVTAVVSLVIFRITYGTSLQSGLLSYLTLEPVRESARVFVSWFWVFALIGFGQHYLNRPKPWLAFANEGIYPLYVLHQTVIVVTGYYICQLPWSISVKFLTIVVVTMALCFAIIVLLIRPFNLIRFFFGIKSKKVQIELPFVKDVMRVH